MPAEAWIRIGGSAGADATWRTQDALPRLALPEESSAPLLTAAHARSVMTQFGCCNLSTLTMGTDGGWYGRFAKRGRTQNVSVDSAGKLTSN